jgi:hypothetical protein
MSQIKVNAVTDASGGNTATINSMTPTADSLQGFRNRIINGDMRIAQRGTSAVTADGAFPVDRYKIQYSMDGAISAQQDTSAPTGFINSTKITVTTADASLGTSQFALFRHFIEGTNISDLAWGSASAKTITLSFWVRSSLTGTFGGSLNNSANTRSYPFTYTISAADTWEQKNVTIAGDTSGTWLTTTGVGIRINWSLGAGTDFLATAGSWVGAEELGATGQTNVLGTLNATWYITGAQLEVGSVATPFERRDYGRELIMCQRYYYRIKPDVANGCIAEIAHGTATTNARGRIVFPVTMRTRPTALEQSGTAGDYDVQLGSGVTVCSAVPTIASGTVTTTQVAVVDFPVASGLTIGQAGNIRTPSPGNGYLAWSAEL